MQQRNKILEFQRRSSNKGVSGKFWLLLSFFAACILGAVYFTSPLALVSAVEVTGNEYLNEADITGIAELHPGMHLWKLNLPGAKDKLLANPWVAKADIDRKFPNIIRVSLRERKGIAVLQGSGSSWVISEDGMILTENNGHSLPWLTGLGEEEDIAVGSCLEGQAYELALLWLIVFEPLETQISELNFDSYPAYISIYTTDGYKALFYSHTDPQRRVEDFIAMLRELRGSGLKGTIDFRNRDGKATFAPWPK